MNRMGVLVAALALAACANGSTGMGLAGHGGSGGTGTGSGASSTGSSSSSSGHGSSTSSSSGSVFCNASNCAQSCCLGPTCTQYGLTDDQACGLQGQECQDCTTLQQACLNGYCQ